MEFYDIRNIRSSSTTILLDNGEIREISNNFSSGAAVRALDGGSWGFVSVDDSDSLDQVLISARKLAKAAKNRFPRQNITLAPVEKPRLQDLPVVREAPEEVPIEDKVKLLSEIEKSARVDGISSTNAVYSESHVTVGYSSSTANIP